MRLKIKTQTYAETSMKTKTEDQRPNTVAEFIKFGVGGWAQDIDKLYTQIGNVNHLHNIIEPFAALF